MITTVKTAVKFAHSEVEASNTQGARGTDDANTEALREDLKLHNKSRMYCEEMENKITLVYGDRGLH